MQWKHKQSSAKGHTHTHTAELPTQAVCEYVWENMLSHTYCTCDTSWALAVSAVKQNIHKSVNLHHYTRRSKAALSTAAVQLQPNHWHYQHRTVLKHKLLLILPHNLFLSPLIHTQTQQETEISSLFHSSNPLAMSQG